MNCGFSSGDLARQRVQRFAKAQDLDDADVTIEEREEYEPYLRDGAVIFAGVDYAAILEHAAAEADVIVVVNPMVPVHAEGVPTGHGPRPSVRDKGYLWVTNQSNRIGMHALLRESVARINSEGRVEVILIGLRMGR